LVYLSDQAEEAVERTNALTRMVIAAPHRANPEVLRQIRATLDDDSADLRRAGVNAMVHLLWPECRPLLDSVAEWDSQRDLRKYAKAVIRDFDRLGIGGC
jgi:hypothetical protein